MQQNASALPSPPFPPPSPAPPSGGDIEVYTEASYMIPRAIAISIGAYLFVRLARLPAGFIHPTCTWKISRLVVATNQLTIGGCSHLDKETASRPIAWMLLGSVILALAASLALYLLNVYVTYGLRWSWLYRMIYYGIGFAVAWGVVINRWLVTLGKAQWNKYRNLFFGSQASIEHLKLYGDIEIGVHTLQLLEFVDACGFWCLRSFSDKWCARFIADRAGTYPPRAEPAKDKEIEGED